MKYLKLSSVFILVGMFFFTFKTSSGDAKCYDSQKTVQSQQIQTEEDALKDFNIFVPVQLKNIHEDLTEWILEVTLWEVFPEQVCRKNVEFTVNKNFAKLFEVTLDAESPHSPGDARRYEVSLRVADPSDGGVYKPVQFVMSYSGEYAYDQSQPFTYSSGRIALSSIPPVKPQLKKK